MGRIESVLVASRDPGKIFRNETVINPTCIAAFEQVLLKELCYTLSMQSPRPQWSEWAERLRRLGLDTFAAWLLEAGSPLTVLGAQALYFGAPFLGMERSESLARLLEDENETRAFTTFLRGGRDA